MEDAVREQAEDVPITAVPRRVPEPSRSATRGPDPPVPVAACANSSRRGTSSTP
ncbi:hypothetical protein [Nocardia sp. NRRL S-836]|uniref:hypothetical protein n=1 Tax=Nocardia sp. NRRL S-836 TaxID=1519492 RepID=UPI0012F86593|nr:hypothetical protein [Nocardia sp. NRRL S-836]